MDQTTRTLAEYVTRLRYDGLEPNTIREAKKRLIDSIGCALGGFEAEPAAIARLLLRAAHRVAPGLGLERIARVEPFDLLEVVGVDFITGPVESNGQVSGR